MAAQVINDIFSETYVAEGSLSSKIGYVVKDGAAERGCAIATAGVGIGVLTQLNGSAATVMSLGKAFARADGNSVNIAVGDALTSDGSGVLVKAASGDIIVAKALQACTVDGKQIRVKVVAFIGAIKP